MPDTFAATATALGYAYQFRYALALALHRRADGLDWQIAIEAADDIEISGSADIDLFQLKHRAQGTALTDSSSDLWKTLRIWSEGLRAGTVDVRTAQLVLVTTGEVHDGSAASYLQVDSRHRDVGAALEHLRAVTATSNSATNKKAYEAFDALSHDEQHALLSAVVVMANEATVEDLDLDLRRHALNAVRREFIDAFLERLEGWWFRRCLQQLATPGGNPILADEVESHFVELREGFRTDNLPIDWDLELQEVSADAFGERIFVQQLHMTEVNERRIGFAIRDYFKAFTQRSRWSRDGLLLVGELETYENRLVDEWGRTFERMKDELGTAAAEDEKTAAAQRLYAWIESGADFPIRPECREPFVTRGSYQMLSDEKRVGWHPDFVARLAALLEPSSPSA